MDHRGSFPARSGALRSPEEFHVEAVLWSQLTKNQRGIEESERAARLHACSPFHSLLSPFCRRRTPVPCGLIGFSLFLPAVGGYPPRWCPVE